jgi:hypothetical protein
MYIYIQQEGLTIQTVGIKFMTSDMDIV